MQEIIENYFPQRAKQYIAIAERNLQTQKYRDKYIRIKATMWEGMAKSFGDSDTSREIEQGVLILANYLNREA